MHVVKHEILGKKTVVYSHNYVIRPSDKDCRDTHKHTLPRVTLISEALLGQTGQWIRSIYGWVENTFGVVCNKPEKKNEPRHEWEHNIKTELTEEGMRVDWILVAGDNAHWRAVGNTSCEAPYVQFSLTL